MSKQLLTPVLLGFRQEIALKNYCHAVIENSTIPYNEVSKETKCNMCNKYHPDSEDYHEIVRAKCNHNFHKSCLSSYIADNESYNRCPIEGCGMLILCSCNNEYKPKPLPHVDIPPEYRYIRL